MIVRSLGRAAMLAAFVTVAAPAGAQAWAYPSMMTPTIQQRQYGFVIANGGDAGTSVLGQWREALGTRTEFQLEAGFADPDFGDTRFMLGGALAVQIARASQDMPLDMVLTGGVYPSFGDPSTLVRIPVQLSMGHRFPIEGSRVAITPFLNPRLSFDLCSECSDDSELSINFDVGAAIELTPKLTMTAAILFPGGDFFSDNGFGVGLFWKPGGIR